VDNSDKTQNRDRSIRLGSIQGVPVLLSGSWFIVAALITVTFAPVVQDRVPGIGGWAYAVAFIFALLLYVSVFIHELSHTLVARSFGIPVLGIRLNIFGGLSEIAEAPATAWREFAISVAGPAVSLALGVAGLGLERTFSPTGIVGVLLLQVTVANLFVGFFNLLPGLPLDGGHVIRAVLWGITGNAHRSTIVACWAGRVVSLIIIALPFGLASLSGNNPSILTVVWCALIAGFVWTGSSATLAQERLRAAIPTLSVADFVRPCVSVQADTPLAVAMNQVFVANAQSIVTTDSAGEVVGIVNEQSVAAVPIERRPWVDVASVARRVDDQSVIEYDLVGEVLLTELRAKARQDFLVRDSSGQLVGVLVVADVESRMETARKGRKARD
jgi:Zn-dependent protease